MPAGISVLDLKEASGGVDPSHKIHTFTVDGEDHKADLADVIALPHTHDAVDVGLGNADDTADLDKPVSTLQQTAIAAASLFPLSLPPTTPFVTDPAPTTVLPVITADRTKISTTSGSGGTIHDYNSWPRIRYDAVADVLVAVWTRGQNHAGAITPAGSELMFSKSTDGPVGKAWTTPQIICDTDNVEYARDGCIEVFTDRWRVANCVFTTWGQNAIGRTEHWDSFDHGATWTLVGTISPSLADFQGAGVWTRSVAISSMLIAPGGVLIHAGFESNTQNPTKTFHRSVLWASPDNGKTWTLRSVIMPAIFTGTDPDTSTQEPNETEIIWYAGKLVAFIRDNPKVGVTAFWRIESGDAGLTWGTPVEVTPNEYTASKPLIHRLPDGRLLLPARLNRTNWTPRTTFHISDDGGLTWVNERLIGDVNRDEYCDMAIVSPTRAVMINGRDVTASEESEIWTWSMGIDQNFKPGLRPPAFSSLVADFDGETISSDGSSAAGMSQKPWSATAGREITRVVNTGYRERASAQCGTGQDALTTGTQGDFKFLHDGSPFTVGILVRAITNAETVTPITGTSRSTTAQVGLTIYAGTPGRINFSVQNGTILNISHVSSSNAYMERPWTSFVLRFDGSNYYIYLHGRLQEGPLAPTGTFATGNETWPLFIGHDPGGATTKDDVIVRRTAYYNSSLSEDECRELSAWLLE